MKKNSKALLTLIALIATTPQKVSAELTNPVIDGALGSNADAATSGSTFATYFVGLWNGLISLGSILVLVYFIWGAIEWISSGGDKGKVESARNRITQAVVGLIILVGSYAIIGFIGEIFFDGSFNILKISLPNNIAN